MSPILQLRKRLKVSQADLGAALGVTQSAISQYEKGTSVPSPEIVRRLIEFAKTAGIEVSFESIYAPSRKNGALDRAAASDDVQPPVGSLDEEEGV
ncbi:helix-turn-helix domain-containing protein [Paraburkholderia sediminicola]|uniref:helix-turn-helix domain-containing protein n=1 Tax=Paraburkholderia sediminicola TaxID=458836 RepID=UPI0038BB924C